MRLSLAAFALMVAVAARAGDAPADLSPQTGPVTDRSRICMMQDSLQPKAGLAHAYKGKTYFLCCQMCVQSFDGDPERYAHAKDPVSGATVDKATAPAYAVNGKAYFFASEATRRTFAKDPGRYLSGG